MYSLRVGLFQILFPVVTVLWSLAICAMSLLPFRLHQTWATYWGDTVVGLAKALLGIRYEIHGRENIPEGTFIIMANHQSTWETAFLPRLNRWQVWILKAELGRIPIFGWALKSLKPIAINRAAGREALREVVEQGKKRLAEGRTVIVFPEGTRSAVEQPQKFRIGGALLAEATGVNILPVAHNAGQFWSNQGRFHPGTIQIVIGEVIETQGKSAQEINQEVEAWISQTRERLVAAERARRAQS